VQVGGVAARALGQQRDRRRGQPGGLQPVQALAWERREHPPHLRALLRPAGDDQAPARARQAAAEQRHEVQGGVVRPVQVLDHERGRRAQLVEYRGQQVLARAGDGLRQRSAGLPRRVAQRAERPRGDQRVAGAPQDAVLARHGRDERRLADPRLAFHDHHGAARHGCADGRLERLAFAVPLEQLHRAIFAR